MVSCAKLRSMKLTPEKLSAFCAALAETCNVGKACNAVSISRWTAYQWRKHMPEFADAWDDAMKAGLLALEDEMHRRAYEGIDVPLTHQGQFTYLYEERKDDNGDTIIDEHSNTPKMFPVLDANGKPMVATVKNYSDTLAIFLAKSHAPDKYRDNSKVELAGSLDLRRKTDSELEDEIAQLTALEAAAASRKTEVDDGSDLI